MRTYRCATCQRESCYEGSLPPQYPFCCERCRMVDLGRWLREEYAIERDLTPEEFDSVQEAARHPRSDAGQARDRP